VGTNPLCRMMTILGGDRHDTSKKSPFFSQNELFYVKELRRPGDRLLRPIALRPALSGSLPLSALKEPHCQL